MTISVSITYTDWTRVNSQITGSVSNFGERDVYLQDSASKPLSSVEDGIPIRPGDTMPFSTSGDAKIWARSIIANSKVIVSSSLNAFKNDIDQHREIAKLDNDSQIIALLKAIAWILADQQDENLQHILNNVRNLQ
ncbi:unnamed protein product [marine sediment metagenome]|uniref:Uncharacterized protein n=1 Tax=marine sediment metagenome TaxID=412755 RepID=X1CHU9_9ZZZZ